MLTIHLAAMIVCNHVLPAGEAREFRGPFHLANYLKPALVFNVPTVVFMAGVSFALGEWTRRPVLVFFLPLAVFLGCGFFLWDWAPELARPEGRQGPDADRPGRVPLAERDVAEGGSRRGVLQHRADSARRVIIANRLLMLGLGLGAVALGQLRICCDPPRRGAAGGARPRGNGPARRMGGHARSDADALPVEGIERPATRRRPSPGGCSGMSPGAPGLFTGAWAVALAEMIELRSSPGLYLFIPLLVMEALGPNLVAVGPFDTRFC